MYFLSKNKSSEVFSKLAEGYIILSPLFVTDLKLLGLSKSKDLQKDANSSSSRNESKLASQPER